MNKFTGGDSTLNVPVSAFSYSWSKYLYLEFLANGAPNIPNNIHLDSMGQLASGTYSMILSN